MEARQRSINYPVNNYLIPSVAADKIIPIGKDQAPESVPEFSVAVANLSHIFRAKEICDEMLSSAIARGTGISKRSPQSIQLKMKQGEAVIAFTSDGRWAGFSYISAWEDGKFVSNSGLIVAPEFRKTGVGKKIKRKIFELSRQKYPNAKIFSLTTGLAVMKMNSELGFEPVTYSEITNDDAFWEGCKSCVNCPILMSKGRKNCLCTALLYDPEKAKN
jgi:hypothetical protein